MVLLYHKISSRRSIGTQVIRDQQVENLACGIDGHPLNVSMPIDALKDGEWFR